LGARRSNYAGARHGSNYDRCSTAGLEDLQVADGYGSQVRPRRWAIALDDGGIEFVDSAALLGPQPTQPTENGG
jgi:hypothetical protein